MNTAVRTGYVHPSLRSNADDLKPLGTGPLLPVITPPMLAPQSTYDALLAACVQFAQDIHCRDEYDLPRLCPENLVLIQERHGEPTVVLADDVLKILKACVDGRFAPMTVTGIQFTGHMTGALRIALWEDVQDRLRSIADIKTAAAEHARVWDSVESSNFYRGSE